MSNIGHFSDGLNNLPRCLHIVGSFSPNGSSAPSSLRGLGVATVARDGTGEFTMTLTDGVFRVDGASATIDDDTGSPDGARATCAIVDETANPLQVKVYTRAAGGTATDYTGRRVRVTLDCRAVDVGQ